MVSIIRLIRAAIDALHDELAGGVTQYFSADEEPACEEKEDEEGDRCDGTGGSGGGGGGGPISTKDL
jgi:hypothetical protein